MSLQRRQHYVPRFYLRYFATNLEDDKYVTNLFFKKTGEVKFAVSINDICVKEHLYSPFLNGKRDYSLETELGNLEGHFQQIWKILTSHNVDFTEQPFQTGLALFISNLMLRSPYSYKKQKELHREIVAELAEAEKDDKGRPLINRAEIGDDIIEIDMETWADFINADENRERIEFGEMIRYENIHFVNDLKKKRWEIKVCEEDSFVTTDNPVVIINPGKERYGINTPGTTIFFPLSPRKVLILDDRTNREANIYTLISREIADRINFIITSKAEHYMITQMNPDEINRRILKSIE